MAVLSTLSGSAFGFILGFALLIVGVAGPAAAILLWLGFGLLGVMVGALRAMSCANSTALRRQARRPLPHGLI